MFIVYHNPESDFWTTEIKKPCLLIPVAIVETCERNRVFELTNHIDHYWWENTNVICLEKSRSTSVGDVVATVGEKGGIVKAEIYDRCGFREAPELIPTLRHLWNVALRAGKIPYGYGLMPLFIPKPSGQESRPA